MKSGLDILIQHLEGLRAKKIKTAVFDVDWLLSVIRSIEPRNKLPKTGTSEVTLDGGTFNEKP